MVGLLVKWDYPTLEYFVEYYFPRFQTDFANTFANELFLAPMPAAPKPAPCYAQ